MRKAAPALGLVDANLVLQEASFAAVEIVSPVGR
jgi:hypothetical protein